MARTDKMPLDFADLTNTANTDPTGAPLGVAAPAFPDPFNGQAIAVDLARPVDHVDDLYKVCAHGGRLHLQETAVYRLWVIQGKPAAAVNLTQEHVTKFVPVLAQTIAMANIHGLFVAVADDLTIRAEDVVTYTDIPLAARKVAEVLRLYRQFGTNEEMKQLIAQEGQMMLYMGNGNAIHREQFELHNWFTGLALAENSQQAKIFGLAGPNKKAFKEWARKDGRAHDIWHHLSNQAIDKLGRATSGTRDSHAVAANAGAGIVQVGLPTFTYAGAVIGTRTIGEILYVGQAAKERYPAGELGKAAIIIGLGMTEAMVQDIMTRVLVEGFQAFGTMVNVVARQVKEKSFPASAARDMDQYIGKMLASVCGYAIAARLMKEGDHLAFENHAKRYPSDLASGAALANALTNVAPHPKALATSVKSTLASMASSMAALAAIRWAPPAVGGGGPVPPDRTIVGIPALDIATIKTAVGTSDDEKNMRMMNIMNSGKGTDTFYDAAS